MIIQFRYSFQEQVREVFSNKIKYLNIIIGSLEDPDKKELFFFWWKITILKNNKSKDCSSQFGSHGQMA